MHVAFGRDAAATPLRHNPRMRHAAFLRCLCPILALAWLAGCGQAPPASDPGAATGTRDGDAQLAWQGIVACADCEGIDTRLRLDRGPRGATHYQLVEAFLDAGDAEYFREEGRWERSGSVLVLHASGGGVRRYRIDADGSLLAADRDGRDAGSGNVLAPVPGAPRGL